MTVKRKSHTVVAAELYDPPKDLWVVSTYFNSEGYTSKLKALRSYVSVMEKSGIPMLLVEGAFGKSPFFLPKSDRVLHIRCPSVMWQKERLLNLAIDQLPNSCKKVAWLDADIFFENPRWAVETSNLLEDFPIAQPFDLALWLPQGTTAFRGRGIAWPGFAAVAHNHPGLFLSGDFDRHGHTGYGWAARKELIQKHGLYDRSVAGSGDHLMAHAMMGDISSPCVTNSVGAATSFRDSFHSWATPFHQDVHSKVGFVRGAILHRWHGDRKKRNYYKRMIGLFARNYSPSIDVRVASSGALEWTEHGTVLGRWMKNYFTRRQEDARPGPVGRISWNHLEELRHDSPVRLDKAIRPFAQLLGPLATLVAERSEDWIKAGLTPVLPNLITSMILTPPSFSKRSARSAEGFETSNSILNQTLNVARRSERMISFQWKQMTAETRWAALSDISPRRFVSLSEQLRTRIRDPRWTDAPELKLARRQLRTRRARIMRHEPPMPDPYDAVVGPGSAAVGLDHV